MHPAETVTLTDLGAGLPLAKPGFHGSVTGAAGDTVEVAGGWYARWLIDQKMALPLEVQSQVAPAAEQPVVVEAEQPIVAEPEIDMGPPPVPIDGKTAKSLRGKR